MTDEEIEDLKRENRRLRQILDALTRVGVGKGALIEVYQDSGPDWRIGVSVCRADCDEVAFAAGIRVGLDALAAVLGATLDHANSRLRGVVADEETP